MSNEKKIPTLYRGKRETIPQTGKIAEPRFTTDTHELFINDGDGKNILVGSPNSVKFKFNYDANIQYDKLDLVNYEGTLYLSIIEENRGNNPKALSSTAWIIFVDLNATELEHLQSIIDTAIAEYDLELSEEYLNKLDQVINEIDYISIQNQDTNEIQKLRLYVVGGQIGYEIEGE